MSILDFFKQRKATLEELAEKRRRAKMAKAKIKLKTRISEVFDPKSSKPMFGEIECKDPLEFPGYAEKIADLQRRSGLNDAFSCAIGTIKGHLALCVELIPEFLMGSMGTAVGEAVTRSAEYACEHKIPLIVFSASGGARMQEGMFSLMQMAKTSAAIRRLSDSGGLFISVLTHPTTGGVTASFAMLGDIILAEPKALIGFAGPRVIEQTIRSTLPEGFQSSEFQRAHGFVDKIVAREDLRDILAELLELHKPQVVSGESALKAGASTEAAAVMAGSANRGVSLVGSESTGSANRGVSLAGSESAGSESAGSASANRSTSSSAAKTASEHVEIARNPQRPHAQAFIDILFENFIELCGDRQFRDDKAILTGIATFEGMPVTVAAHLKGVDLEDNISCNFGMPHPEGYRKFIRAAKQAEKFDRPLITFIDTPGAYPGAEAEERGQGEAIARCLFELSALKVPVIAVLTGEGGSGGALALGVADRVIMYENAIYSVLSPEGFASILWKDAKRAAEASEVMKLTARDLYGFGMVDAIVQEPAGGAHNDATAAIEALRPYLRSALSATGNMDKTELVGARYEKFRKFC